MYCLRFHWIMKAFELPLVFTHAFCIFNSSVLKIYYLLLPGLVNKPKLVGNHSIVARNKYLLNLGQSVGR